MTFYEIQPANDNFTSPAKQNGDGAAGFPAVGGKGRILVVDDEPDIRAGLADILTLEGYTVEAAASGAEALQLLAYHRFDLMVLDMRLPGPDGMSVIRQMRRNGCNLPVIILTGHATLENAIAAVRSEEVVDYLLKPASNEALVQAVARALHKHAEQTRQQRLLEAAGQVLDAARRIGVDVPPPPAAAAEDRRFICVSPLTLDCKERRLMVQTVSARTVDLTKGETAVLAALMAAPGQVMSCRRLVYAAWGYNTDEADAASVIRPYISRLRKKIEANPKQPQIICTVRRRGYCFMPA